MQALYKDQVKPHPTGGAFSFVHEARYNSRMATLRGELYAWRDNEAAKRGVETFRILTNQALDEIVRALPRTKDELTAIKGIKEAKYQQYGKAILAIVDRHMVPSGPERDTSVPENDARKAMTVSAYLDILNRELYRLHTRVRGEISSIKFQGSAVYIGLKDSDDGSTLAVFMWARDYALAGFDAEEGMDVTIEGRSEVYKPTGRLSFRAETIELAGEGALKKAYDAMKKKLTEDGIFAPERKRPLPEFPERIGVITSKQGAVIHDFLNNLGKFGFRIRFIDSRVEGAAAVKDLLRAIRHFSTEDIDVLVVIRGGGSLESLQAFNNESVVRAIAECGKPTIVAIGHDKDVPLAQLAADHAPSTPTAATGLLNRSWDDGRHTVRHFASDIVTRYGEELWQRKDAVATSESDLRDAFARICEMVRGVSRTFSSVMLYMQKMLTTHLEVLRNTTRVLTAFSERQLADATTGVNEHSRLLSLHNPMRQLQLGYSILTRGGKILRTKDQLPRGSTFEARLSDGTIEATSLGIGDINN